MRKELRQAILAVDQMKWESLRMTEVRVLSQILMYFFDLQQLPLFTKQDIDELLLLYEQEHSYQKVFLNRNILNTVKIHQFSII